MDDTLRTVAALDDVGDGIELRLRLRIAAGQVAALAIENRRPTGLLEVLRGRRADEVPALVQRLFPICGHAHALACAHAIAAARGDDAHRHAEAQRDLLWAELAMAHGWRSSIDWPGLLGQPPQLAVLRQLIGSAGRLRTLAQAPSSATAAARSVALDDLATALVHAVFGGHAPPVLHADALCAWSATPASPLHALLTVIRDSPLAGLPAPAVCLLATPSANWFAARLSTRTDFERKPGADGMAAEVGAYACCSSAERALYDAAGPVAARLLAMLAAAVALIARLHAAARESLPAVPLDACSPAPASGCAVAETVRGPLAYWLRLEAGRIADLRSVAPTEWVLHPRGALYQWLPGLPAAGAQQSARLALAAVDPCAVTAIELEGVADA